MRKCNSKVHNTENIRIKKEQSHNIQGFTWFDNVPMSSPKDDPRELLPFEDYK